MEVAPDKRSLPKFITPMYQSPIRITGYTALQQEERSLKSALLLARRKLEAEFELADSPTITYGGQELNRQEVVTLFDELRNEERLSWHLAIYEDEALLCFLEEGTLQPGATWAANPLYSDNRFIHFVSPYYAEAINVFYRRLLTGADSPEALQTLAYNPSLMVIRDAERAFRHATRYFLEKKNELMRLQQRAEASEAVQRQEVRDAMPDEALAVLNYLPDTYDDLRYQFANALNNLCVAFDQKNFKRHALIAIEKAALVSVEDEELLTLIPRNLTIIRSKQGGQFYRVDEQGKRQPKWGWIALCCLMLIRVLAWIAKDDSSDQINIRHLPSFQANLSSMFQVQPRLTFNSLVFSLVETEPDSFRFAQAFLRYRVPEPARTGDAVYQEVMKGEMGAFVDSARAPRQGKLLQVQNKCSWHLLLCYRFNNEAYGIRYIAPGAIYRFSYSADTIVTSLLAGKDWDTGRRFIFNSYLSPGITEIRGISGGYNRHPENMDNLVDAGGSPIFRRLDSAGVKAHDILKVADSAGNTISIRQQRGSIRAL